MKPFSAVFAIAALTVFGFAEIASAAGPLTEKPEVLSRADAELVGHQAPNVEFTDLAGKTRSLSAFVKTEGKPYTVVAFTGTSCPLCRKLAPTLAALEREWAAKGVQFLFVNPMSTEKPEALEAAVKEHGFRGPYVRDKGRALASALRASTTTEVFVLDAARTVLYRGAVDDQYGLGYQKAAPGVNYLADALKEVTAGRRPLVAATTAPGCELELPDAESREAKDLTWHRDISRIVQNNCQECHREGGTGPFPLVTREDVIEHAGMIRKVVTKGQMPPWFAAPATEGDSHAPVWGNDRSLPPGDKEALLAWLAGDRAEGDPKDAPLPRVWPGEWRIGEPDLVIGLPEPVQVKATGLMKYVNIQVPLDLTEDKWVRGFEVKPEALAQVHHVLVFVIEPGKRVNGDNFLAAYAPGLPGQLYPEGYAKRLPAGSKLHFQLHYTPNGTAVQDRTRLGLVFAKEKPKHEVMVAAVQNHRIRIPAGAADHEETASLPVPEDVQILALMPHMHVRGKSFRFELAGPDGSRRVLLDVPRYDFNWQLSYRFAAPLRVAKGSRVEAFAKYDNSADNPFNPDPTVEVRWGDQTEEEMMIGYLEYTLAPKGPAKGETASAPERFELTPKALRALAKRLDVNGDKQISLEEAGEAFRPLHSWLDLDRDGVVTREEAAAVLAARARRDE